jgi:hypothetical protein
VQTLSRHSARSPGKAVQAIVQAKILYQKPKDGHIQNHRDPPVFFAQTCFKTCAQLKLLVLEFNVLFGAVYLSEHMDFH